MSTELDAERTRYCSFCGRSDKEVSVLVAGDIGCVEQSICNLCVDTCNAAIGEHNKLTIEALRRENARLREALEKIWHYEGHPFGSPHATLAGIYRIATTALTETHGEGK